MPYEYQVDIGGVVYGMNALQAGTLETPLFDRLSIGNACSAELTIPFWLSGAVPRMARITPYCKKTTETSWEKLGEFWIDTRSEEGGVMSIVAYDAMLKGEVIWEPRQSLVFPLSMSDAVNEIARLMGVKVDSRTKINSGTDYVVDYPANDYTLRDVLRFIAAAHGGNWVITRKGELRLVPLFPASVDHRVGKNVSQFSTFDASGPISGIRLLVDNENSVFAGSEAGYVLSADCPYATQTIADDVLALVVGKVYKGYRAEKAILTPLAELGDGIEVNGLNSMLAYRNVTFGPAHMSDISAPGENVIDHEYPYLSTTKKLEYKLASTNSRITKTAEQIRLEVKNEVDGLSSSFSVTLNEIKGEITGVNGELSTVKQTVSRFDVRIQSAQDKASQAIQTANGFELKINNAEKNAKAALDAVNGLKIEVSNGAESSTLKLMAGSTALSSKEIKFTGMVTFAGLSNGTTTIDGACIKTGKISADRIDVSTLKVNKIYTSGYEKVAVQTVGTRTLYLGGDGSYSFADVYLYAGTKVYFTNYRDFDSGLEINLSSYEIKSSYSMWKLGSSVYPFNEVHCSKLYVDGKQVVAQSGDKDVTQLKNSIYTASLTSSGYFTPSSTQMSLGQSSSYWANAYIKQLYLSSTCYITAGGSDSITVGTKTISATPKISTLYSGSYYVQLSTTALLPGSTSYNLGNTSKYWNYVYARILRLYYNNYSYIDLSCNSSKKLCVNNTAIH